MCSLCSYYSSLYILDINRRTHEYMTRTISLFCSCFLCCTKVFNRTWALVAHTCNSSYSGGRDREDWDQEDWCLESACANGLEDLSWKIPLEKKKGAGWEAQDVGLSSSPFTIHRQNFQSETMPLLNFWYNFPIF
jgi:hypothetical protein